MHDVVYSCVIPTSCSIAEMVWLCRDWATLDVVMFGEDNAYEKLGKESGLFTCSHRGDLDWVAGFIVGAYYKFLHVSRGDLKTSMIDSNMSEERGG